MQVSKLFGRSTLNNLPVYIYLSTDGYQFADLYMAEDKVLPSFQRHYVSHFELFSDLHLCIRDIQIDQVMAFSELVVTLNKLHIAGEMLGYNDTLLALITYHSNEIINLFN